ncbi:Dimeric alpha-beta barrel [Ascosphaera apis ARSEF 7405]|uniref:Dimeric alpha-beta barrel n=1 Tax=Ascosphaera apis ARSEF 7405 TaxID=392613 RepID=A0A168CQB2_9EURO|nr:Dimeric alpha-beta barrel [Ascosphaera apis ARSEF 7405]
MSAAVPMNAIVTFKAAPGKADAVISMYNEYAEKVKKNETDCSTFYCIRLKDTDDFICVEKYTDFQAQEDHVIGDDFKAFKEKISPLLETPIVTKIGFNVGGFEGRKSSSGSGSGKGGIKYKILSVK